MEIYDTVSEAVNGLKTRGFNLDFNLIDHCLVSNEHRLYLPDFEIVEVYRFEGNTDPADEAVVYGIQSHEGLKGILVTGYGASAEDLDSEWASKLAIHRN